jgi:hypothetical protein
MHAAITRVFLGNSRVQTLDMIGLSCFNCIDWSGICASRHSSLLLSMGRLRGPFLRTALKKMNV